MQGNMELERSAPAYKVAPREVFAVEHPMVVKNLDNALKTFGSNKPFEGIVKAHNVEGCVPLYLKVDDPMCPAILSHNTTTNNVLLKITVPKPTGRKRKRGSQDPWIDAPGQAEPSDAVNVPINPNVEIEKEPSDVTDGSPSTVSKEEPLPSAIGPSRLLRTLRENVGNYEIEAVGQIKQTHRFRGLADYQHSTSRTDFLPRFKETVLTGELDKIKQFRLRPDRGWKKNDQYMPPPTLTRYALPFGWQWQQNPYTTSYVDPETGKTLVGNKSRPSRLKMEYLKCSAASPSVCPPPPSDPDLQSLLKDLKGALDERPLWTRRALKNRVSHNPNVGNMRYALQYVAYQFRGGPWRDIVIKIGIDPRTDPKYRDYQVMFFHFDKDIMGTPGRSWQDDAENSLAHSNAVDQIQSQSHTFDGNSVAPDGKIWQLCDITDPLLKRLIRDSPYRETCDEKVDGWFNNGSGAKIKAIMRTKLDAIQLKKELNDIDFEVALEVPDIVPDKKNRKSIQVPVPDVWPSPVELQMLHAKGINIEGMRKERYSKEKARSSRIRPYITNKAYKPLRMRKATGLFPGAQLNRHQTAPPVNVPGGFRPLMPAPLPGQTVEDESDSPSEADDDSDDMMNEDDDDEEEDEQDEDDERYEDDQQQDTDLDEDVTDVEVGNAFRPRTESSA
ncbi:RNA polymerase III transcription factor IIIC subunit-domain-containing protein [Amylocarpus encephaloides]|uniref:RNA polymerase III transcription factor IIIC subunit-domain-containing protein n=1 Tax=Amylocarpus encephaloides TaxID=45428 RepID=A0A9P8C5R6_9HELO|nr:RNA polymerase III transcription factor IIIC subunit-domain-containing protein [Amylocarpus encephaloides]